jgi:hypothetical protein
MIEYKQESGSTVYQDPDLQKLHEKWGLPYQAIGEIQLAYALAHTSAFGLIVAEIDTGEVLYGHSYSKAFNPTEIAGLNRSKRVKLGLWLPK